MWDVYLGELTNGGSEMKTPQRLTLDDRIDWPGGWSLDGKTVFLYSDRNGNFDIYKQGVNDRNAETVATGPEEKWAPQISPDGKWVLYMQWPKSAEGAAVTSGKLMRSPLTGGPAEAVMDIKGHPGILSGGDPTNTVQGYPSFRCPAHGAANCILAEQGDNQIVFTSFDPVQGRKAEAAKVSSDPDSSSWDLSPDGSRVVVSVFDYKAADIQIVPLTAGTAGGTAQKLSAMPWTELAAIAWAADGKSLFLASYSSRGTAIVRMPVTGGPKLLFKQPSLDIFFLVPSPDGRYLAFGPIITNANAWTIASFPRK
jgi:Tol biopolymer transport system component